MIVNIIRVRNRVEKCVIFRKIIYLFVSVLGCVEDFCSEMWCEVIFL